LFQVGDGKQAALYPESEYVVTITDQGVSCQRPNGQLESVDWADLKVVLINTTDQGPLGAGVLWFLSGEKGGCIIPQGVAGEYLLLERLQALDGFDNEALIKAMRSTENQSILWWRRKESS
jgi:hypothetical protein